MLNDPLKQHFLGTACERFCSLENPVITYFKVAFKDNVHIMFIFKHIGKHLHEIRKGNTLYLFSLV